MKALTICQPYAHLIAIGEKKVENRKWPPGLHQFGPLAIHAGKSRDWMQDGDDEEYPGMAFGAVVAVADLVACVFMDGDTREAFARFPWLESHPHASGPWCWIIERVRRLANPVKCSGAMGLWDLPEIALRAVEAQLAAMSAA